MDVEMDQQMIPMNHTIIQNQASKARSGIIVIDGFAFQKFRDDIDEDKSYWVCMDHITYQCDANLVRKISTGDINIYNRIHAHAQPSPEASTIIRKTNMTARKVRATKSIPVAVAPRSQQPPPLKRGLVEDKDAVNIDVSNELKLDIDKPPPLTPIQGINIEGTLVNNRDLPLTSDGQNVALGQKQRTQPKKRKEKEKMTAPADKYHTGDRVFAKLKGYPWWPAKVKERISGKVEAYKVYFYGTYDEGTVKLDQIEDYSEENVAKYSRKPPRNSKFPIAMKEIDANMEITDKNIPPVPAAPSQPVQPAAAQENMEAEEGELLIDEGPPILTREDEKAASAAKNNSKTVVVPTEAKPKQAPKRASRAKRETSSSAPNEASSTPSATNEVTKVEPPAPATPVTAAVAQPEIVSRSGRKIKPKRFADDFDTSTSGKPEPSADSQPAVKRAKRATTSTGNKAQGVAAPPPLQEKPAPALVSRRSNANKQAATPTPVVSQPTPSTVRASALRKNRTSGSQAAELTTVKLEVQKKKGQTAQSLRPQGQLQPDSLLHDENMEASGYMESEGQMEEEGYTNGEGEAEDYGESSQLQDEFEEYEEVEFKKLEIKEEDESKMQKIPIKAQNGVELEICIPKKGENPENGDNKETNEIANGTAKNIAKIKSELETSEESANNFLEAVANGVESKDDELAEFVASKLKEDVQNQIQHLIIEGEMIEIIGEIMASLSFKAADCDRAIDLLDRLSNQPLTTLMLKKHPEVVDTVRQIRNYYGNVSEWKLTDEQKLDFEKKSEVIRKKAESAYQKFKSLFCSNSQRPFQVVFKEALQKFSSSISGMSPKSTYKLVQDPSEEGVAPATGDSGETATAPISNDVEMKKEEVSSSPPPQVAETTELTEVTNAAKTETKTTTELPEPKPEEKQDISDVQQQPPTLENVS